MGRDEKAKKGWMLTQPRVAPLFGGWAKTRSTSSGSPPLPFPSKLWLSWHPHRCLLITGWIASLLPLRIPYCSRWAHLPPWPSLPPVPKLPSPFLQHGLLSRAPGLKSNCFRASTPSSLSGSWNSVGLRLNSPTCPLLELSTRQVLDWKQAATLEHSLFSLTPGTQAFMPSEHSGP